MTKKEFKQELKDYFVAECAKRELDTADYIDVFKKGVKEKRITTPEAVVVYVKGLKEMEEEANKPQKSQADRLVEYGLQTHLFLDQRDNEYARVALPAVNATNTTNGHPHNFFFSDGEKEIVKKENRGTAVNPVSSVSKTRLVIMPLNGSQFKKWLAQQMYITEEKVPSSSALNSAITVLAGKAQREGEEHPLYNRVAPDPDDEGFWVDMADNNWRAIHVTAKGWAIVEKPPILFRRYKHQKPLAIPVRVPEAERSKTALRFLEFVNVPNDEVNRLIFMCTILSYMIPELPHPILTLFGSQGSAKTTLFRFVKRLIDPSKHETLGLSDTENGLMQQLDHSYLAFYDNISRVHAWQSDIICKAQSGTGHSKRRLYTDDEDVIYNFKRCIGLNGINVAGQKGDLLDRIILFELNAITDESRRTEKELASEFEKVKPLIFGAVLDILSTTLKLYPTINRHSFKRLADFHKWGCAIAQALGYTITDFDRAYSSKVELQNEEALSASSTAVALMMYCEQNFEHSCDEDGADQYFVKKTPTELFVEVKVC